MVAGGVGVLVVLAFVAFVAAGSRRTEVAGERVAVVEADEGAGVAVLAGRCADQRVLAVALSAPDGRVLWRAAAPKGSIERRWVVDGDLPVGATEEVPLSAPLPDRVTASVVLRHAGQGEIADARPVDLRELPEAPDLGSAAPACGRSAELGRGTSLLFVAGAGVVVLGYAVMVVRWVRGRR